MFNWFARSFSVSLFVVLNCVGSGALALPSRLAHFGLKAFYGWIFTAFGALSIGMIFVRLAELNVGSRAGLHLIISEPFQGKLRQRLEKIIFIGYLLFATISNASLVIMFVIGLSFFFPQFSKSMWCYASIIGIFGILNGFGVKSSKSINNFLAILKMVIMIGLPLLACFLLPFDQPIDCGNGPIMELLNWRDISKCMFITLWAFVGIESIMMDSNESPKRIRSGMMNGIVLCTLIYVFNSYVLMRNVPSLGTVAVGDFNLFNMIFPNQDWIFPIILMVILTGSLHGWTYTAISTCEMGNRLFPRLFKSKLTNLIGVSVIPFLVIVILKFWLKREDALNLVFELSTFVLLIICAVAIFSFYKACFARKISDNLHVFKSRSQTISDIIYICIATIYVGLSLYASLDLILNQAL